MAGFTAIALGLSVATAAASTGMAMHQAAEGRERQRDAEKALDSYQRQEITNAYADLSVPMEGYRMREQQIREQTATGAEMLAQAGARGVVGGTSALMRQSQMGMAALQADLEKSQFKVKQMIASEEARIQGMRERREEQDIGGLGAELAAGRSQYETGLAGAVKGAGAIGTSLMGYKTPEGTTTDTVKTDTTTTATDVDPYADPYKGGVDTSRGYGRYGQ